ncbi:hypothetical protein EVAR_21475_1 [Eumeta japonica]|uniref:Uncharacterized protein n=1 Tax=Eumeta variegata TaxID=151549 RepID=A0A4C1ZLV1_EUMVA|nr:hypothetical protein EVAR_21475_1 [Eumeta japonica]
MPGTKSKTEIRRDGKRNGIEIAIDGGTNIKIKSVTEIEIWKNTVIRTESGTGNENEIRMGIYLNRDQFGNDTATVANIPPDLPARRSAAPEGPAPPSTLNGPGRADRVNAEPDWAKHLRILY